MELSEALRRPETYDPWKFTQWALENEQALFVRLLRPDPGTAQLVHQLVALADLPPAEWVYWVQRCFLDSTTLLKTAEGWKRWALQQATHRIASSF